jgi:OOP family OmpA-OmpF porin
MIRKLWIGLGLLAAGALVAGCATKMAIPSFQAQNLEAKWGAGNYVNKVDNFVVVMDASSSMEKRSEGMVKFDVAKAVVDRLNETIPPMDLNSAFRTFGHSPSLSPKDTELWYGPARFDKTAFQKAVENIKPAGGNSPMGAALVGVDRDMKKMGGKTALIIVSDGMDLGKDPEAAAKQLKADYGDRLCIYTIAVGDDATGMATMKELATIGGCGFASIAKDLLEGPAMASFVENVFMAKAPPKPVMAPPPVVQTPKDSDHDGVTDDKDQCPNTPIGAKVDSRGCWVLSHVLFDFDRYEIKAQAYGMLNEVVTVLDKNPGVKIQVDGHTDSIGTAAYNQKLSEKRAEAVVHYLEKHGISADRLSFKGYGLTRPIATNKTKEGRALNRRAELTPME